MTANATAEDKEACFNAGMSDYNTKPTNLESLKEARKTLNDTTRV